jgi:hypothetical protein
MRILNLKELELVAGAEGNYDYPVLSDEAKAMMTPDQIEEWEANEARKYAEWMNNPALGDRSEDYEWMLQHGGVW